MTSSSAVLDAQASEFYQKAQESFERCDTDGFVSQACHQLNGGLYRVRAKIEAEGGTSTFKGLYQGDRRIRAKLVRVWNKYSHRNEPKWLVEDDSIDRKWIPCGPRSRVQKQLGLTERTEVAPAWAVHNSNGGTGFSGLTSVTIEVYRTGCAWGSDAKLV